MKKSDKQLLIINIILISIFLLNIFVKNIFNNYTLSIFLGIILFAIIKLIGYERDKNVYKKNIVFFVVFYSLTFIGLYYLIGLLIGFGYTGYSHTIVNLFKNMFPVILLIVSSEYLRYAIARKGINDKKVFITTIITFVLVDVVAVINGYNTHTGRDLLELLTYIVLPSIFKNYMLTYFAKKFGITQNIVYRLIMELYVYIVPVKPAIGIYLDSILLMVYPIFLKHNMQYRFEKEPKKDLKDKKIPQKIVTGVLITLIIVLVMLVSNFFRFWLAVVASGSMQPTINIGDAIIVDKSYKKHLDKLKVGDILVFRNNDEKIYTHRIIELKEENGIYSINTQGDREGNAPDNWVVSNDNVIGIVKFRIKYVGYPTVWLTRAMEARK